VRVDVASFETKSLFQTFVAVAANGYRSSALDNTGNLWGAGDSTYGQVVMAPRTGNFF